MLKRSTLPDTPWVLVSARSLDVSRDRVSLEHVSGYFIDITSQAVHWRHSQQGLRYRPQARNAPKEWQTFECLLELPLGIDEALDYPSGEYEFDTYREAWAFFEHWYYRILDLMNTGYQAAKAMLLPCDFQLLRA